MDRSVAEFFASLASVADLSSLEQWQKEKLVSDARKADPMAAAITGTVSLPTPGSMVGKEILKQGSLRLKAAAKEKKFSSSWRDSDIPYQWLAIWRVHPFAYRIINQLLDHGQADVRELADKKIKPTDVQATGAILYDAFQYYFDGLFEKLWETITQKPLPFVRCAFCRTIFVPASRKHKKFCSKECGNKAVSLKPERREYMKNYMKGKRALQLD